MLCQFSFAHGVLIFHLVFWAWIPTLLQGSHVLVWSYVFFRRVVMLLGFVCVDN
jgi:hypothetical protein